MVPVPEIARQAIGLVAGDGPFGVEPVDRIVADVAVEVGIPAGEADRVLGRPASGRGIVVPQTEAHQSGLRIVEAAAEPEGLESGPGVEDDPAEGVVVEALCDRSEGSRSTTTRIDFLPLRTVSAAGIRGRGCRRGREGVVVSSARSAGCPLNRKRKLPKTNTSGSSVAPRGSTSSWAARWWRCREPARRRSSW